MRAMVSIGSYDVPEPQKYSATTATIVDSARNVEGYVVGAVIRENVAKVSMSWNFLTASKWAELLSKFDSTRGGSFYNEVTFYCQDTNQWETRTMYVSDRVADVFLRNKDGSIRGYTGVTMSLVEV